MIILTAANKSEAKDDEGNIYKDFSFLDVIKETESKAREYGYKTIIYDLGSLGIGTKYVVNDDSFIENGYYSSEVVNGYKSKSLFKPDIVDRTMCENDETVIYLDGDAQLCCSLSEVDTDDYDVGVTLRDKSELVGEWYEAHIEIVKYVNAGVIMFRPTSATRIFVSKWRELTQEVGNDQMALNKLVCPDGYPENNSIHLINGVRVKFFPGTIYNFYYFGSMFPHSPKILHFKGAVRHYYPFNLTTKIQCGILTVVHKLVDVLRQH